MSDIQHPNNVFLSEPEISGLASFSREKTPPDTSSLLPPTPLPASVSLLINQSIKAAADLSL